MGYDLDVLWIIECWINMGSDVSNEIIMKILLIILSLCLFSCSNGNREKELSFTEKMERRDQYVLKTRVGDRIDLSIYDCTLIEDTGEWAKYKIYPYYYTVKGDTIVSIWKKH